MAASRDKSLPLPAAIFGSHPWHHQGDDLWSHVLIQGTEHSPQGLHLLYYAALSPPTRLRVATRGDLPDKCQDLAMISWSLFLLSLPIYGGEGPETYWNAGKEALLPVQ